MHVTVTRVPLPCLLRHSRLSVLTKNARLGWMWPWSSDRDSHGRLERFLSSRLLESSIQRCELGLHIVCCSDIQVQNNNFSCSNELATQMLGKLLTRHLITPPTYLVRFCSLVPMQPFPLKNGRVWEIMSHAWHFRSMYGRHNYCAWALEVLTITSTESIIDSKDKTTLTDLRLITLTNSVACYHEAFDHYSLRSIYRSNNRSGPPPIDHSMN